MSLTIIYSLSSYTPDTLVPFLKNQTASNKNSPQIPCTLFNSHSSLRLVNFLFSVTARVTCIVFEKGRNSNSYPHHRAERALQEEHVTMVWLMHTASTASFHLFKTYQYKQDYSCLRYFTDLSNSSFVYTTKVRPAHLLITDHFTSQLANRHQSIREL